MKTPTEIIDFLESLLGIYFYDIRHKHRSVFILCDTLVELTCKIKIVEKDENFNTKGLNFIDSLQKAKVSGLLKKRLILNHKLRNDMQHKSSIITIDEQKCADSLMDLIELIRKLWGKYSLDYLPEWVNCALRIVKLQSSQGKIRKRKDFKNHILNNVDWNKVEIKKDKRIYNNNEDEKTYDFYGAEGQAPGRQIINKNELVIKIGSEEHWSYILRHYTDEVEECFNILSIDEL